MAFVHSTLPGNAPEGARLFFRLFSTRLPDEYHLWYGIQLPDSESAIDFGIFHPRYGVWVVQLNDWSIDQIREIDEEYCVLIENGQETLKRNPILDAKHHHIQVRERLLRQKTLLHQHGPMEGNLLFPVHHLAVFHRLSQQDLQEKKFDERFPDYHIITSDMLENIGNSQRFPEHLLLQKRFPRFYNHLGLNEEQIETVKQIFNPLDDGQILANATPGMETGEPMPEISGEEAISEMSENFSPDEPPTASEPVLETFENAAADKMEILPESNEEVEEFPLSAGGKNIPTPEANEGDEAGVSGAEQSQKEIDEDLIKSIIDSIRETSAERVEENSTTPEAAPQEAGATAFTAAEDIQPELDPQTRRALQKVIELNHQLLQRIWSRN
jgi:hypothetical protein